MRNPIYAQIDTDPYSFDESVRFIHATGVGKFSHQMFRGRFTVETMPNQALMLVLAANAAEVYVNGKTAAMFSMRSYVFEPVYEVYDITPYLVLGENVIAVYNIDTGEEKRAGFALEVLADGNVLCKTDGSWLYKKDEAFVGGVNYAIMGGGEEEVFADRIVTDFMMPSYDDSAWEKADVLGDALICAPAERFRQSMTKAQTANVVFPRSIAAVMKAKMPVGYDLSLSSVGNGVTLAMATMTVSEDTVMMFKTHGGIRSIAVDGDVKPLNEDFSVDAGEHFLNIAYSWSPAFFIRTAATLTFSSPAGGEEALATYFIPTPPIRYPWNEYHGRNKTDDIVEELLAVPSFDKMDGQIKEKLTPMGFGKTSSVVHDIHTRDYSVPKNGFAEERIFNDSRIVRTEEKVSFEKGKSFLSGGGFAVIEKQDGMTNFILDFGEEKVGRVAFDVDAPAGTVIDIQCFEMINDAGILYMDGAKTLRYHCRAGMQEYISLRRRGFRYLSICVHGNESAVKMGNIRVIETRYPTEMADFSSSDARLDKIYAMSARTAEVCMLDLYVDCPGYEQNAWTGDARCTANVNLCNFGAYEFDAQYLKLIAQSVTEGLWKNYRTRNPRYMAGLYLPCACFPTYPEGCIPVWSFMWLLQVYDHYMCTADKQTLSDVFYAVKETLARCEKMTDSRGLFDMQGAWNLIEWANNDLDFYGEVTANNAMLSYCFGKAAEMAEILGEGALAEHYLKKQEEYRDAVNKYCWDDARNAYVDTVRDEYAYERYIKYMEERGMETLSYEEYLSKGRISVQSNTMALLYDIVPEERREAAMRFLLDNMKTGVYVSGTPANRTTGNPSEEEAPDGYVHIGSPFFMFFALKTLYKFGYDELAMEAQKTAWGEFLDSGLTTCLETFKKGKEWTRSIAHAWSAGPAIFMMTDVLGIKPTKPGFAEFIVEPKTACLDFAEGSVPTPKGRIFVEWHKKEDGSVEVICNAPSGCKQVN